MSEPRAEMGLRLRDPLNCPISSRSHHLDYDGSVPTSVTLVIGFSPSTLISLINVEVGINLEGVQKLPNHLTWRLE